MTGNDKEIEVLLRRYAKGVAKPATVDHLDADELNAFAEGGLPAAARQRYVSHLADCGDCRKLASELVIASGVAAEARVPASQPVAESWWRKLSILLAPATLRYAAFAVVLVAVVGIGFLVWQRPEMRNADMIAQKPVTEPAEALKQAPAEHDSASAKELTTTTAVPQATVPGTRDQKLLQSEDANSPPPPPKPADEVAAAKAPAPVTIDDRVNQQARNEASPSYAPPPPANENFGLLRGRDNQNVSPSPGGPRRNENYEKYKEVDRSRSADVAKARDEDRNLLASKSAPAPGTATVTSETKDDSASKRARLPAGVGETRGGGVREQPKAEARKSGQDSESEEAAQTRSVGGRKFNRQGNAWIDSKFKSSMSLRTVSRGSEDFRKLDSGLRSIANQLSGEIVVVWKGKAYRIR